MLLEDLSTKADAILAGPGVNTIKDLKGKKVAYEEGTTSDILLRYDSPRGKGRSCFWSGRVQTTRWTLGAIIAHELAGHGWGITHGGSGAGQHTAIRIENQYHVAHQEDRRCQDD